MGQFIIRRMLYSVVTLFILSATIFLVVRFTGDPVALMAEASARGSLASRSTTGSPSASSTSSGCPTR